MASMREQLLPLMVPMIKGLLALNESVRTE